MYQKQTERMLADGGMMQEGGTVDEASGNEVPTGSLKEEVRDDVDAKLSVGEFVVPADVVRYIGLENLMKMRDKAKAGLKQMSDIGQMGNAEEAEEEDVGEFSSAVDDVMGEEDEDSAFSSAVDETMNEEKSVRKMAVGGYVQPENAATYANAPLKGFEMVSLVNDAGNVIYIPYINGKPQLSIPSGYKVKTGAIDTSAAAVTAPVTPAGVVGGAPTTTTSDSGGDSSGAPAPSTPALAGMVSGITPSEVGMIGKGLGLLGFGLPGLAVQAGKGMISNASTALAASQNQAMVQSQLGLTDAEAASPAGQAAIASAIDSTPNQGEAVGTTATTGPGGTGAAAVGAAAAAANAAAANGLSDAAQGAASQAAANSALNGGNSAQNAQAGANAAADTAMSEAADTASDANQSDAEQGAQQAESFGGGFDGGFGSASDGGGSSGAFGGGFGGG